MFIALRYEQQRLEREGIFSGIFDLDGSNDDEPGVFDVSRPEPIAAALRASHAFASAFTYLSSHGLSEQFPGFDILSLDKREPGGVGRLIELKSSGVNARTQDMSWNEWKTASIGRPSRSLLPLPGRQPPFRPSESAALSSHDSQPLRGVAEH